MHPGLYLDELVAQLVHDAFRVHVVDEHHLVHLGVLVACAVSDHPNALLVTPLRVLQSIDRSINQSINQSTNQSINKSTNQPTHKT